MKRLPGILALVTAASLSLLFPGQLMAQQDTPAADRQADEPATATPEATPSQQVPFDDQELAAMLILQHEQQQKISQFVAAKTQNEQLKQFADRVSSEHSKFVEKMHADVLIDQGDQVGPRVAKVFKDLAQQMRERQEMLAQQETGERRTLGFRGTTDEAEEIAEDGRSDRTAIREQRQNVRDERQDVGEARRENRGEDRDEAREEVRDERSDVGEAREELRETRREASQDRNQRRDNARRFLGEFLPALRNNLPEILEIIGEAVEEGPAEAADQKFVIHKQCVDRHTASITQELQGKQGSELDEAYLHYAIFAHLEVIDGMETIREYASPDFQLTLDEGLAMTRGHLQDARDLLSQGGEAASVE